MDTAYLPYQPHLSMAVFALVGAITPGPVNILALGQSLRYGLPSGLLLVTGASLGYTAIVVLLAYGLQLWALAGPWLLCLQLMAAAYLVYLAWRVAHSPVQTRSPAAEDARPIQGHWRAVQIGAVSQCINPKAWLYALSGVSLYTQHGGFDSVIAFSAISCLCCSLGIGVWAGLGSLAQSHLQSAARQRLANRILALMLLTTLWPLLT
ncbi:LysE family translocator [Curvibacter sp. CHRR-16]|uniref:LysE family translocator n=1 Tax=Curvibacter sp. CHRR-16 TaxID=2835872 RepID=UPI001BD95B52|nr:LysE family translocator [Curvibacter sp. CHRR-16]MBT0568823.1 LysE family translocator [Curvibacter sp. CHRR-16]